VIKYTVRGGSSKPYQIASQLLCELAWVDFLPPIQSSPLIFQPNPPSLPDTTRHIGGRLVSVYLQTFGYHCCCLTKTKQSNSGKRTLSSDAQFLGATCWI